MHAQGRRRWLDTIPSMIVAVTIIAMGVSCATAPPTPEAPDAPTEEATRAPLEPIDPEWAAELQERWAATKRVHFAGSAEQRSPWTLNEEELASAQEAAIFTDRDPMRVVHQSRFNQPVFFAEGRLTDAGEQARALVQDAWTHGVAKPANWPDGLGELLARHHALHEEVEAVIARPLSDSDLRRQPRDAEGLDLQRIAGRSLTELEQLAQLRDTLRANIARMDGVMLSGVWQLARATREMLVQTRWNREQLEFPQELYTAPEQALHLVAPHHEDYDRLREAYARFSRIARRGGGWETLPISLRYGAEPGREHKGLIAVRERLAAEGFVPDEEPENPQLYDDGLKALVDAFQYTRGIKRTGELDVETRIAMNIPVETLVERLELGLIRWHRSRSRTESRYVRVNVARNEVQLMRDGQVEERIRAVVGRPSKTTPRFSGHITHMVAYPWWFGTMDDPKRVAPGRANPLGLLALKIEPLHYLIYLHGTNAPKLLDYDYRFFSAGCIRMRDPTVLGSIILEEDPGPEDAAALKEIMARKKTHTIWLKEPVPVFLEYNTTFIHHESGHAHFMRDYYVNDRKMFKLLQGRPLALDTWPEAI